MPRMFIKAREPFSSYSHFIGAIAAACGLAIMLIRAVIEGVDALTGLSVLLFGLSLIALYSASAVYHYARAGEQVLRVLKKLDHSMIYVLIAGSYTPFCVAYMPASEREVFLGCLWAAAFLGILFKLVWLDAPRWIGTLIYLAMGWSILVDLPAFASMPTACLVLVAAGGVSYSVGAVMYIAKRPNLSPNWGFHVLFHLFILAGSLLHFLAVFLFVA